MRLQGDQTTIGVVIVNYNSELLTLRCVKSLLALGRHDLHVIVVDNSPADDTQQIAKQYPTVQVLHPESNRGFAAGCNLGIQAANSTSCEYVFLFNPDAYCGPEDPFDPLLQAFRNDPTLGMLVPKILRGGASSEVWFGGAKMQWYLGRPAHVTTDSFQTSEVVDCPTITGCAVMIRGSAIHTVGPMDERYFLYFEDSDYAQAFLAAGFRIGYFPSATVYHDVSKSVGLHSRQHIFYHARNRILFMRRWASTWHFGVFLLYTLLIKVPGAFIVFALIRGRPKMAIWFCQGVWAGLVGNIATPNFE